MNFRIQQSPLPIHRVHDKPQPTRTRSTDPFKQLLNEELATSLKVSKHAEKRLQERGITFKSETWSKIENSVHEAKTKGIHDALVLTKESALVVNTTNSTVITALERREGSAQIFTNINGTIVID